MNSDSDSSECSETLSDLEIFEDAVSDEEYISNWSPRNHESMFRESVERRALRRIYYDTARRMLQEVVRNRVRTPSPFAD